MSSDHLISRPAHLIPCHGCGRHILTAIDGGITVAADPQSIDLNAEIAVRIAGRAAYDIVAAGRLAYLIYRDIFRVGHRAHPVVADHQCPAGGKPRYRLIPPAQPARKKTAVKAVVAQEDICPF